MQRLSTFFATTAVLASTYAQESEQKKTSGLVIGFSIFAGVAASLGIICACYAAILVCKERNEREKNKLLSETDGPKP